MSPNEIYALPPIYTRTDLHQVSEHVRDVDFFALHELGVETLPGFSVRYYANHSFDGEREWSLFSAWYERPFMICQEAGRGGQDHSSVVITDAETYYRFVDKLRSLCQVPGIAADPQADDPSLTDFYNHRLEEFYQQGLRPKYKVGDIVMASVPRDHIRDRKQKVITRVRIDKVRPHSPHQTYSGIQIDRRMGDRLEIEESPGQGNIGAHFGDEEVVG